MSGASNSKLRFNFGDLMFKLISCLVAGSIVLVPFLPARADFGARSSGFGVSIGAPSPFGFSSSTPYGNDSGLGNRVILRSTLSDPYNSYYPGVYSPGFYSPGFSSSTVIVAPRARTVIVNPGYNNDRPTCGSAIYGSPIASPIPVNPFTGLACR
jgi:hypothetical protein